MIYKKSNTLSKQNSNNIDLKEIDHINDDYEKKARSQTNKVKTQLNGKLKKLKSGDYRIDLRELLREKKKGKAIKIEKRGQKKEIMLRMKNDKTSQKDRLNVIR